MSLQQQQKLVGDSRAVARKWVQPCAAPRDLGGLFWVRVIYRVGKTVTGYLGGYEESPNVTGIFLARTRR